MGNTNCCAFCNIKTGICNYSFKFKKNICINCLNYIQACSHCNEWYTKGLIRYNEKLFCIKCLNDLHDTFTIKPQHKCISCNKKGTNTITHNDKIYCNDCITKLLSMYKKVN